MGAFAAITCSEFARQWCLWFSALLHVGLLGGGATMVVIALYIEGTYTEYMALIGFKIGYTPLLLQVFGGVGILAGFGAFFAMIVSLYPNNRKSMRLPLLAYTILLWVPIIGHIVMLCMTAKDHGRLTSKNGVVTGMEYAEPFTASLLAYKDKIETKASIDLMQQTFECCGNADYRDWFEIQWYSDESFNHQSMAVQQHTKGGRFVLQDVPFSCCDPTVKRPCIHHQVYNNKIHFNYDYKNDLTIYKEGCRERMLERYDQTLTAYVLPVEGAMLGLYVVILLLVKYLQTSMATAMLLGDPEVSSPGYLFQFKGDGRADEKLAEKLEKDKLEKDEAEEKLKAAKERVLERIKKKKEEEEGGEGTKKKKKKINDAGEEVDDDDDENNNAGNNESRNNESRNNESRNNESSNNESSNNESSNNESSNNDGLFARILRKISNLRGQRSDSSSDTDSSSSSSGSSGTSSTTSSDNSSTATESSRTNCPSSPVGGSLPVSPGKLTSDATRTPAVLGSDAPITDISNLGGGAPLKPAAGRVVISGPRSELKNPKLLEVIRAIARLHASTSQPVRPRHDEGGVYRSNCSGNAGGLEVQGLPSSSAYSSPSSVDTSSTASSSRATTVRFGGSETTTFISDSGTSSAATTSRTATSSGTGTTTTTTMGSGGSGTDSTTGTTTTGTTTATTGATTATTGSTTDTTGATTDTTGSTTAITGATTATTGSTTATTGSTSATTGFTSVTTGSTSATTGSTSATTGSTSATTGSTSATTGSTSATTGSTSATTGSTSATTGSTSATTGSTSATTGSTSATTGSTSATTSATGTGTSSTKVTTVTGSSTGSSLTDSKTGTSSGTGTSGATTSATGTTVTGSATGTSISSESGTSRITGSETRSSSVTSPAAGNKFSGLSTQAVTTGSHIIAATVAADRSPRHSSSKLHRSDLASSAPSSLKAHRSSSSHHRRRSPAHPNRDQTVDLHVIPLPLQSPPRSRPHSSSSRQGGLDRQSKKMAGMHHVYDEIAPYSIGSPHPMLVKSVHRRRSPKRPVKDGALVNGAEPHVQRGVVQDYHVYEEIPDHVYQEISDRSGDQGNQIGGRLYSDLSVQFIPVEERVAEEVQPAERRRSASKPERQRVYEEIPTYKNRPIPNVPVDEHIYEEIPFGHHVYKNHPRQTIQVPEHIYEEIPFGHHAYKNHPIPNVPVVEHIYEEIPYGHHLYKNRPLPNIPEEEQTYEEIPYGYHLYRDRLLPNIPEEEHIYEEIPSGHHLYKHRTREDAAAEKLSREKSAAGRKETKGHRAGNVPAMEPAYEEISHEDHAKGNVATPSVQDQQSGYLIPKNQGYLLPERQRGMSADRIDPNVPNQQRVTTEPMSRRQRPRLSRSVGAATQQVYDVQGTPNDQRHPVSNPELVNFLDHRNPKSARSRTSSSSHTGLQDSGSEYSYSRSSETGTFSSSATPHSVPSTPARQGLPREHHDARQTVQSGQPYTGLSGRRSDYSYTSLAPRPSQTDTSSGNTQAQTIANAPADHRLSETGSGRLQIISNEPIYTELQDRRSRHVYTAVGSTPSQSNGTFASSASHASPSKQTYEGPAGTGYGRAIGTQSEPAYYIGLQGRESDHTYTAVGPMPSRTDSTGLSQTVQGEPTYQGPGDVSRIASSRSNSRTGGNWSAESATNWTRGQAPNQHLYANAVPQAPPPAAPSAGAVESDQRLASSSRSKSRHGAQNDMAVSLQSSQSQLHYQPIRHEDSAQSPRKKASFQVQLQLTKSPKHSSAFVAGRTSSVTPASLSSSQPQLRQQITSGQSLTYNQPHKQYPVPQVGTPSRHSSTPNTSQTSSSVHPVSVGSSQSQPQQADPQRGKHGGSSRHNRPTVPLKTTIAKQLAKQILSSGSVSPMSHRSENRRTSPQRVISGPSDHRRQPLVPLAPLMPIAAPTPGKQTLLDGPANSVSNLANRQRPDLQPIRTGDVEHHKRPLVPLKPTAMQPTASQIKLSGLRNEVSDRPQQQRQHPSYDQVRPENLSIIQGLAKQAAMSSQYIMDSPVAGLHRSSSSGPVQLQKSNSQVDGDVDGGNTVPHSSRNPSQRSSPNLRFQGVPNDPPSDGQDERVRPPWDHRQRPLVPPKPTKAQPQHDDDKSVFRAKLAGIYARATTSEPTNNYRNALNLARSGNAAENVATSKTSQASSSASQALQPPATAPLPPPLKLPIKGILVKRNDLSGASRNPSPSDSLVSSTHSEFMDTRVVDRRLAVRT